MRGKEGGSLPSLARSWVVLAANHGSQARGLEGSKARYFVCCPASIGAPALRRLNSRPGKRFPDGSGVTSLRATGVDVDAHSRDKFSRG